MMTMEISGELSTLLQIMKKAAERDFDELLENEREWILSEDAVPALLTLDDIGSNASDDAEYDSFEAFRKILEQMFLEIYIKRNGGEITSAVRGQVRTMVAHKLFAAVSFDDWRNA